MTTASTEQLRVCRRYRVRPSSPLPDEVVGIARNARGGTWPINAARHAPAGDTCGWFIWAGSDKDFLETPDFFEPIHVVHLPEWSPLVVPYLCLPPGWRFTLAPGFEDVWYDEDVLACD
jgi:hypothetical protein